MMQSKRWEPTFYQLRVHAEIEHQMRLAMKGVESTLITGPRGVGKTYSVQRLLQKVQASEAAMTDSLADLPRSGCYFQASECKGTKTVLIDLKQALTGREVSAGARRAHTPAQLIEQIVTELMAQRIHILVIDEAQLINPSNLEMLRQIPDAAAERQHPMGIVYTGNSLVQIGQLGQRIGTEIQMLPMSAKDLRDNVEGFHPGLRAVKEALPVNQWERLTKSLADVTGGNFRRFTTVLRNADELAQQLARPIDEAILKVAISKLAAEV
jgi:Cdc6-like AAA superfamily ATPase